MRASRPVPVPIDSATFQLPLIATPRATGFPQATADYEEVGIDFNRLLYRHPAATYIMRVARDGMNGSDLLANDLVIIDAALTPQPGDLVVAQVEDTFLLCRFERQEGSIVLIPENTGYQPLSVTAETAPLALVDVNNCYVSCERIFQPSLQRRGVLVVGSNDGNIVARSDEVRALGIPMGAPLFEYEALIKQHHIAVCSANWALYGDISARVMATLAQFTSELEVYSVDEAWLTLPTLNPSELCAFASDIRATIRQYVKLPASVGVAPTKTLAKAANKHAKKTASGVLVLQEEVEIDALLATMPVEDVWMIGPHRAVCLAEQHIRTALDLKHAPEQWVKQRLSVVGLRAVLELRGIPCIPLTDVPPAKQQIACGQAFGQPVEDLASLKEAIVI